jgi:hypothetical protein
MSAQEQKEAREIINAAGREQYRQNKFKETGSEGKRQGKLQ